MSAINLTSAGSDLSVLDAVLATLPPPTPPEPSKEEVSAAQEVAAKVEELETPGVFITLLTNFVRVEMLNGAVRDYSYADFVKVFLKFHGALDTEETSTGPSMKLPRNVYVLDQTSSRLRLGQFYPECIQSVNYLDNIRPSVVPNIIITTILRKEKTGVYRMEDVKYWCTNRTFESFDKELITARNIGRGIQYLPFSNTYETGSLCFGTVPVTREFKDNDLRAVRRYYDLLWESAFNNDLGVRALSDRGDTTVSQWYKLLADLAKEGKPFPYSKIGLS